jgi:peptidyl-prolyl cis-trans isomerase A (cyclophilin A)
MLTLVIAIAALHIPMLEANQAAAAKRQDPSQLNERAPEIFRARFETSQGVFVIEAHRDWAPIGADRFYNLVTNGFYDDVRFFRVLSGFMAQFGLNGDPDVQAAWASAHLQDEPPKRSNVRGFVSFAKESRPNTRYTMVFINYKDNSYLDESGFAPFGQVVTGMEVVDKLYSEYGRNNVPDQRRIKSEGNAYLAAEYPKLDFVKKATIERAK